MISWQQALQNRPQASYEPTTREIAQIHQAWAQKQMERLEQQRLENPRGTAWMSMPVFQQAINRFGDWADNPSKSQIGYANASILNDLIQQSGLNPTKGFMQGMQSIPGFGASGFKVPTPDKEEQRRMEMAQMGPLSPYERNRLGTIANRTMEVMGPRASGAGYNAGMSPQSQAYQGGMSGAGYNAGMAPGAQAPTEQDWSYLAGQLSNMGYPV